MAGIRKPDLPKALAARIRAAQSKVREKRLAIIYGDRRIENAGDRVRLYDLSPEAYANDFYPGKHVDSYPVQTRIQRDREELAYYERRAPERIVELAEAEAHLAKVEDDVLIRVLEMRPSGGRVLWPRKLKPFETERHAVELQMAREDERAKAQHTREMERLDAAFEKADEAFRRSISKLVDSIGAEIKRMPRAKQEAAQAAIQRNLESMQTGALSPMEFLATFTG